MNAKHWLLGAGLFTEAFGVITALAALAPGALDPVVELLYLSPAEVSLDRYGRLLGGIMGGVMAGWGAMLVMLARSLDELTPTAVARALAVGAGTWFCLDGLASLVNGAYLNVLGNSAFLALLLVPVLIILRTGKAAQVQASARS